MSKKLYSLLASFLIIIGFLAPTVEAQGYPTVSLSAAGIIEYNSMAGSLSLQSINLAPLFQNGIGSCYWGSFDSNGNVWGLDKNIKPAILGHYDNTVLSPFGNPSLRVSPGTEEIDFDIWHNVNPGDHIILSIWVFIPNGSASIKYGPRIGIDFRTASQYQA